MKRTILLLTVAVMLTVFAAPALAQTKDCTDENKAAWYQKFLDNRKGEQKIAYDNAKDYLKCSTDPNEQITQYLQKWVNEYDKVTGTQQTNKQFEEAYKNKAYAEQIKLGKQIIATDPENSSVYIIMGLAGLGEPTLLSESSQYAKKAIEMLEAGKPFLPYNTKDQPLAYLNYEIAKAGAKSAPTDAIPFFLKAARYESDLKKSWQLYYDLATAYGEGPRAKLTNDYKPFVGQTETPESKLILANLNQVIDRQIDALARAAALADATSKKEIMEELTDLYKYRNKSDTGLNELVAGVLTKPLPDVPTPLTSLPTQTPSTTPSTSGSGTSTNAAPPTGGNGAAKTGTTGAATTTTQKTTGATTASGTSTAKPAATPTPSTRKPRSNHRRG